MMKWRVNWQKFWQKQQGMTLIEAMVGLAILAIFLTMIIFSFKNLKAHQARLGGKQAQIRAVNTVVQRVKSVVAIQPRVSGGSKTMAEALADLQTAVEGDDKDTAMPIVWSAHRIEGLEGFTASTYAANHAKCPVCRGRLGYTFYPLTDFPGGYVLSIAISHPDIYFKKTVNGQTSDVIIYKQYIIGGR